MREAYEFDAADFDDPSKSDPKAFVRFFIKPVKNDARSLEEGRPIFDDKEYCEVIVPGNQTNRPIKLVNDIVKQRYAQQYRRWKETGEGENLTGTVLTEVPWLTRSQVEELTYYRIRTLEQLAGVDDNTCGKIMGLYELRRKAKAHVEAAEKAAPIEALQAQIDERDAQIAALQNSVAEQGKMIKALQKQAKE